MAKDKAQQLIEEASILSGKKQEEEVVTPTKVLPTTPVKKDKALSLIEEAGQLESNTLQDTPPKTLKFKDSDFVNNMESVDPPEVNNALGYAFKLGIADTYRGIKQISGVDKEQMKAEQQKLNQLMQGENGGWVTAAYFAGAILDPAGWLIPFGKAKTLYQMGKYGMVSGAIAGATGYVDDESFLDTRTKQAALGAVGGGIIAPAIGGLKNLGVKITGKGETIPVFTKRANLTPQEAISKGGNVVQVRGAAEEVVREEGKIFTTGERALASRPEREIGKEPKTIFDTLVNIFKKPEGSPAFPKTKLILDDPRRNKHSKKNAWFLERLMKGYEENVGKRILKVATTGEGGTAIAGGIAGFNVDPQAPVFDLQRPLSSRFGRAFVGASLGYLGVKGFKNIKIKKTYGKGEEEIEVTESIADILGRNLIDKYGLSKDYKVLLNNYDGTKNDIASSFVRVAEQMKKLTPDENKILYNMLEGDVVEGVPNNVLKELSSQARDLITQTGQKYVDLGLLTEETFLKNKDRYLGRLYKTKEDQPLELKKIGDDLKPRGLLEEDTYTVSDWFETLKNQKSVIDGVVDPNHEGWELFGDLAIGKMTKRTFTENGKRVSRNVFVEDENGNQIARVIKRDKPTQVEETLGQKGTIIESEVLNPSDKISVRWQYTKPERLAIGEIEDSAIAMEYTGMLMANTVAKYQFFADVASKFAREPKGLSATQMRALPERYIKIPETTISGTKTKRYGKLSGKYVPETVYKDIVGASRYQTKSSNYFYKNYKKLNSLWKSSKTAWNPTVHVNNVFGNIILSDLADVPLSTLPKALRALQKHNSKNPERSEIVMLAIKYGVFDADFVNKELKNFRETDLSNIYKSKVDGDEWNNAVNIASNIYNKVRNNGITSKLEDWYRIEDHVFRLNAFMHRLNLGDTAEDAALFSRKQFIDYDIDAPVINFLRHTATPFLSFTYRVVPLLAESAILRPTKYAKYAALGYGLSKLEEIYGGEEAKVERALLPDYEAGNIMDLPFMPKKTIRLPIKDENGRPKYLNISRLYPGGDALSFDGNAVIPGLPQPLQPSFGIGGDVFFSFLGYDIFRKQKEPGRGTGNVVDELTASLGSLGRKLIPNFPFVPGAYSTVKLERALKGDVSAYREPQTELEALLNSFGIKVSNKSIATLSAGRKLDYERKVRQEKSKINNLKYQVRSNQITMADFDRRSGEILSNIDKITKEYVGRYEGIDPYSFRLFDDMTDMFGFGGKATEENPKFKF